MHIIFTKHATGRILSRNINKNDVENAILNSDKKVKNKDGVEFKKRIGKYDYNVVAKEDQDRLIVISAWVEPPLPGSFDLVKKERYRKYLKSGLGGKIWMQIRRAIFNWEF